ncbi:hypothetical protein GGR56DRAFT_664148 [Xylariaceae sp. FL0804]|nr:hypothetical protein GGR56DRAFT_664148 [Xylariaceae sp. FL0804]
MSALKRKDAPGGTSSANAKASKRSKPDQVSAKSDAKSSRAPKSPSNAKPASAPTISRLKEEEPLFPRGGGSVLSPLEQKQISIQAKQDVLFEQETARGAKTDVSKKRKAKASSKDKKSIAAQIVEESVKIEGLNYQRLVKGSLVLGQVTEINPLDIVLALPNNLLGHVPITAISDVLSARLAAEAEAVDEEDESDAGVDLKDIFAIGQYLRAYVVSTVDESPRSTTLTKPRKHIELSLRPDLTNPDLSGQDLVENSVVMATVVSDEDHGFVMDLGLPDSASRGFLSRKELAEDIAEPRMQPGSVALCLVTGKRANGKILQLTTLPKKLGKVQNFASQATTINVFLPGCAVEFMVSEITNRGIAGKVMGSLDVTADLIHSGLGPKALDLESKYSVGKKVKARVICNFPAAKEPKIGISLLDHVVSMQSKQTTSNQLPHKALTTSSVVEQCTITKVESDIGVFVDVGVDGVPGFVHISRLKDGKVDMISESTGPYSVGSTHRGRVMGYNPMDGLFQLSFERSILEQPFLRIEDVPIGQVVTGVIEKLLVNQEGVSGLLVKLAEGIHGFVPEMHLADVRLQHPEKKFREGLKVKARVLATDLIKRQVKLTLKKTLVNSEATPLQSFEELVVGMQSPGTIVKVLDNGAIVQFYGSLRAFLPVAEMSEAYIRDPKEHFRVGQVVNVHVLNFDVEAQKLFVSCKDPSAFSMEKQTALKALKIGDILSAKVTQKTEDDVFVEITDSSLKATVPVGHLADRPGKTQKALKGIRVGQTLSDLVVLDKNENRRFIVLSKKPSLVRASQDDNLLASFEQAKVGELRHGFVRNITVTAIFVEFAGQLTALLPKSKLPKEAQTQTDFGLKKSESITVRLDSIDRENSRIIVAASDYDSKATTTLETPAPVEKMENPVDETISSMDDISSTQLNVKLADNIQGRNPKLPLSVFRVNQIIRVRVLGVHDARNHRFLPISHRSAHSVLELSAKPSDLKKGAPAKLSLDELVGSLWINSMEISDDVSQLENLSAHFPVGSALRGRLDLSARAPGSSPSLTWDTIKQNMVIVQLSDLVSAPVHLIDLSDDYDEASTMALSKNGIIRVAVVDTDKSNKRLRLSSRPSRITSVSQLSNVSDKGLFVGLGGDVTAMVRISDLSDKFLKDWKDEFQIDQLVKGRVLSLKASVVEKDFGQTVTGKVRKVETFGAFILVDGSANVSGLCHRTEMAEKPIDDARKLFNEGDIQKKRINFGLKPSYFDSESDMDEEDSDVDGDDVGAAVFDTDDDDSDQDDVMDDAGDGVLIEGTDNAVGDSSDDEDTPMVDQEDGDVEALDAGADEADASINQDTSALQEKKKKRRKPQIVVDKSGDLDAFGPRTAVDYEQLLNRQPNSSSLWIEYMAHQMQVSEIAKARQVAERAITTISSSEETEKLNAWVAYLNLEVHFGTEDTVDQIFKRACEVNDQQEVYQRLASIYVQEGKGSKADSLFQALVKKFGSSSPDVWYNYAHWLHASRNEPDRARALLPRAWQALPKHLHLPLSIKAAALEFNSPNGNPELGRTLFEALFSMHPKRFDLWSQLLDHEDVEGADKAVVRDVFERATKVKGLKARAAKKWFRRWGEWEDKNGDAKSREKVSAKAAEWARQKAEAKASREEDDEDEE